MNHRIKISIFLLTCFFAFVLFGCSSSPGRSATYNELLKEVMQNHPDGIPDPFAELTITNHEFRNARIVRFSDVGSEYDREWFKKMGYKPMLEDDFEKDGYKELAAIMVNSGKYQMIILKVNASDWKIAYKLDLPDLAMMRTEDLHLIDSGICIIGATGQRGFRFMTCWDGRSFSQIKP